MIFCKIMRNEHLDRKGHIPASQARIFWDTRNPQVIVLGENQGHPSKLDYFNPGGACWVKWRDLCKDKSKAKHLCFKAYFELVYIWELDPVMVDKALGVIIEYNEGMQSFEGF